MTDNAAWTTTLTFDETEAFNTAFSTDAEIFDTTMNEAVEVVTSDHTKLINRDAAQQHPISAITNLNTELENRVVEGNTLTNQEIEEIIIGG